MDKKQMREAMKSKLAALEKPEYEQKCFEIAKRLYALAEWEKADVIAVTVSAPFEIDTWQIIRFAWISGKIVCIPKCDPETKQMKFFKIDNFTYLEKVYAGLYEPDPVKTSFVQPDKLHLLIVPGLLFNAQGYRIGFGGGYYDRFLSKFTGKTVSLAFSFQLQNNIPVETHDLPVQKIVTDKQVINCQT